MYKKIILRVVNRLTSCSSIVKILFKQIVTRDEVLALIHHSCEEVAVYVHHLGFVTKHLLDLHRVDELKNFAANNLLSW